MSVLIFCNSCRRVPQLSSVGGGPTVRRSYQSTIVGGACAKLRHSDRALRTAYLRKRVLKQGFK